MARHFSNFLDAYMDYACDSFVPDRFHRWVGLSLIAGMVERKITLKQDMIHYVPNIYVMLVSHPKQGKSTAIERGMDILEQLKKDICHGFRIIPTRTTDAAFIDLMKITEIVHVPGSAAELKQSAGYFYASEASSSALQNLYGDFVASLTAFYDCPRWYRDKTKGNPIMTEIENGCMNILAGTTFNFLKNLVNENTIDGGFASRLLYVVNPERKVRTASEGKSADLNVILRAKLMEDLAQINKLVGPMRATPEWWAKYNAWQPIFDQYIIDLNSIALEAIMTRKDMNLIKTSMLLSISESDSLVIEERHFDQALALIDDIYKDVPMILSMATIADKNSQKGITQFLAQMLRRLGGRSSKQALLKMTLANGNDVDRVEKTFNSMIAGGMIKYDASSSCVELLVDPDRYL